MILCLLLFDLDFVTGRAGYWDFPRGIVGRALYDMPISMSGYFHFVQDSWRFPLFQAGTLGLEGSSIIATDSIPLLALAGRIFQRLGGAMVNPFGLWAVLCILLNGAAMAALVGAFGLRTIAGAVAAGTMGVCMPAFLARWGHLALGGHFVVVAALAMDVGLPDLPPSRRSAWVTRAFLLALLSLGINPYLFAIVLAILIAGVTQAALARQDGRVRLILGALATLPPLLLAAWISGFLTLPAGASDRRFGEFSMNLASPFTPQISGLFPAAREMILDATGGQYEGLAYSGGGIILLIIVAFSPGWGPARLLLRRYDVGIALLALFSFYAISHRVYFLNLHIVTVPLPGLLLDLAEIFRSGGRFIWPVCYTAAAAATAAVGLRFGSRGTFLLLVATIIQWIDTAPLRAEIGRVVSAPQPVLLRDSAWRDILAKHDGILVLPSAGCARTPEDAGRALLIKVQLQLLAGLAGTSIAYPITARTHTDCAEEALRAAASEPARRMIYVYLPGSAEFDQSADPARHHRACRVWPTITVCAADSTQLTDSLQPLR